LAPIAEALALNCHLRELDVRTNDLSEAFKRERLVPALELALERADTTLREFECAWW
jgi:hypothetical protein